MELINNNQFVDLSGKSSIVPINDLNLNEILNSKMIYVDMISGEITCWDEIYGTSNATGWSNQIVGYTQVECPFSTFGGGGGNGSGSSGASNNNTSGNNNGYDDNGLETTGNYNGNTSSGSENNGGGSSGNSSSNTVITTPTYPSPQQILKDKFLKQLTGDFLNPNNQKDCFNNLPQEQKDEVLDYVGSFALEFVDSSASSNIGTSEEAVFGFAEEAITSLCSGGEVDFDDEVIIHKSILENPKVNCVYEKLNSLNSKFFNNLLENNFGDKKEANLKFTIENIDNQYLARTFPYINGVNRNYKIVFDTDFIANATTIEIATAFIHEVYHAELYERLYKIGLINTAAPDGSITFNDSPTTYHFNDEIFAQLVLHYTSFSPTSNFPSNYQHNLFNILGYRNNIILNLTELNILLDSSNSFQNIINNDPLMSNLHDVISNLSWYGLEATDEYLSLNPIDIANISHSNNKISQFYPQTCN